MYSVGQIVYMVISKKAEIIPCLIIEENTKTTLEGKKTDYNAILSTDPQNIFRLSNFNGKIFNSLDEAVSFLNKKFETYVDSQRAIAIKLAAKWQKKYEKEPQVQQSAPAPVQAFAANDPRNFVIKYLDNKRVASLPELVRVGRENGMAETTVSKAAEALLENGTISLDENMRLCCVESYMVPDIEEKSATNIPVEHPDEDGRVMMRMPDGTMARVKVRPPQT
jgi:hypothetical protein